MARTRAARWRLSTAWRGSCARAPHRRRAEPADAIARLLDRVPLLTADELDRLALADPTPIAFVATIRRFIPPERLAVLDSTGREAVRRLGSKAERTGVRDAVLAYAAELILAPDLDELLSEPFRSRTRERLMRGWEAAVGQPRYGPNGAEVAALLDPARDPHRGGGADAGRERLVRTPGRGALAG